MAEHKVGDGVLSKIKRDEIAISAQLKRYRAICLTKNGQGKNTTKFIEMVKYLNVLLFSHCKNTISITPELAIAQVKELSSLLEDLVSKYQDLNTKYINKTAINSVEDTKTYQASQLCSLCSQTIKKTEIQRIKSHILNENSLYTHNYDDDEDSNRPEDEDHLFFAQVNKLLTNKQADIMKNQKKLGNFHQTAMQSLDAFLAIQKDFANLDNMPAPNISWLREAKKQMEFLLKDYFSGKIPPWITKMLYLFTSLHYRTRFDKLREVEVQTDITTNNEIFQLKRKNIMSARKLEDVENISKQQEKDLVNLQTQCEHLQTKVVYYKEQINRLIQEIDTLKSQNQLVQKKLLNLNNLNKSRRSRRINDSETQIDHNSTNDFNTRRSIRKKSILGNDSSTKIFPKINNRKDLKIKSRNTHESRTSIKVSQLSQPKKNGKNSSVMSKLGKKMSNLSRSSHQQELRTTNRSEYSSNSHKRQKQIQQSSEVAFKDQRNILHSEIKGMSLKNIIPEVEGQSNLEDERNKVKMVSKKLKQVIKHGINQTQRHKVFRSSMPLPGLKKVPHKTIYENNEIKQNVPLQLNQLDSYNKVQDGQITPSEAFQHHQNSKISSIYNQLKQKGCLIKISEDQFKMVIKIKAFNFGFKDISFGDSLDSTTFTRYADRTKKTKRQKSTSRQMSELLNIEDQYKTVRPSQYSRSPCLPDKNSKEKDYSALFTSQSNAYKYENSFHKVPNKQVYTPTKIEEKLSKDLFQHLNKLKQQDQNHYRHICSYIRYPFQVMQNNIGIVSINELKESTFSVCFQRIAALHSKCKKEDGLCVHLAQIRHKIFKNSQLNQTI